MVCFFCIFDSFSCVRSISGWIELPPPTKQSVSPTSPRLSPKSFEGLEGTTIYFLLWFVNIWWKAFNVTGWPVTFDAAALWFFYYLCKKVKAPSFIFLLYLLRLCLWLTYLINHSRISFILIEIKINEICYTAVSANKWRIISFKVWGGCQVFLTAKALLVTILSWLF